MIRRISLVVVLLIAAGVAAVLASGMGWFGRHEGAGEIRGQRLSTVVVEARASRQRRAAEAAGEADVRQILFGDLHVHTTISTDAFMLSLPLAQGEGAHPPADACDFARFCADLDFWSINDHAEGITPRQWQETVESIRQCNAVAGVGSEPDTVAFLGWEWTQVGATPEDHYGHKNVVMRGLGDDEIPTRPIASTGQAASALTGPGVAERGLMALGVGGQRMQDFARLFAERSRVDRCPDGIDVRELPADCIESVATPGELYRKLDEWGFDSMVIPHGTSWGFYTPPGSAWDKQLTAAEHDPQRQRLVEIFSGHGNSEQYRDWRAAVIDEQGNPHCPEPTSDYLPSCWRAGEIIAERCRDEGLPGDECGRRAARARALAAAAGVAGHLTVSGESPDDWLDAGQCRDCFQPPFNHRPLSSVQYMMALRNFDEPNGPERFRFGFIGSSDNHFARPGTGYKEVMRKGMSESRNMSGAMPSFMRRDPGEKLSRSQPFDRDNTRLRGFQLVELERQASFFMPGGLAAVHATGRSRDEIWAALERREVYGTSGPRILLWFDLSNPPGLEGPAAMGSTVAMRRAPRFEVHAVGSFEQEPGCPDYAVRGLSPQRLTHLCKGECYYPADQRRLITRIEVVRIQPRVRPGEPIGGLIDDPWRVFSCPPDPAGCSVEFEDPGFASDGRDSVYYVRAIEQPSPAINAGGLRCERDAEGRCTRVRRCGTADTVGDDCLSETEERAWSSPIFVDWQS